ncbi:MAG: hypothetical protein RMK51_08065 [Meiothermus sp.]|nr:hypothetical protein [Meiothermus sp.]MCS7067678.1 hypothetical protein [Meiothermus sp.]MDW8425875.1 hypothetical protein [Meiothermus sp.]
MLNKFRGDARLLFPGPEALEALTSVPTAFGPDRVQRLSQACLEGLGGYW